MPKKIEIDGYMVTSEVEDAFGVGRRWIYNLIRRGKFPPPDVPGRLGAPHRWRRSTIRKALDDMAAAAQPDAAKVEA